MAITKTAEFVAAMPDASPEEDALANEKLAELQATRAEQEARRAEHLTKELYELEVKSNEQTR